MTPCAPGDVDVTKATRVATLRKGECAIAEAVTARTEIEVERAVALSGAAAGTVMATYFATQDAANDAVLDAIDAMSEAKR